MEDQSGVRTKNRWKIGSVYVAAAVFCVVAFSAGVVVGTRGVLWSFSPALASSIAPTPPPENVDLTPVWTAWKIIDDRYVPGNTRIGTTSTTSATSTNGFTDPQKRVWGLIQGLAASLEDPYTVFLPPTEAEIFEADISGSFEGVGMEIANRDGVLTVVSPLKGTPAYRAGIKASDRITEIDGVSTRGLDVNAAVQRIRGPRGTTVTFTIYREGETAPLTIEVTRDVINVPTINTEKRDDGIFVISLYNFYAGSPKLFADALQEFINSGYSKLIIDLRGNPGGYLEAAVDIASWFVPSGKAIVTEDYGAKQPSVAHRSRGYNVFGSKQPKVIILVDKGSASASEILAGALRYYGVGKMVGTNTFGKGSVQELVNITPETSLKITVARWLGPDDKQIPVEGLEPDVKVEPTQENIKAGKDVQLEKAIEMLNKQ